MMRLSLICEDYDMNLKLILLALAMSCALFVSTKDCSIYETLSTKHCVCIRKNGDSERAQECSRALTAKALKKAKLECFRKCYGDNCEKICSK